MYDEPNDEHDFWGGQTWTTRRTPFPATSAEHHDEPTRQLRRVDPRERRADVPVAQRPALLLRSNGESTGTGRFRLPDRLFGRNLRTVDGRIDPFLARLGMIVLAVVLLIPVAVSLRPEHKSILRSAPTGGATAIPDAPLFDDAAPVATDPAAADAAVIVADTAAASSESAATAPASMEAPTTAAVQQQRTEAAPTATTVKKSTPVTQPPVEKVSTTNSCATKYTIVAGDSWIGIARRAGVTTKALLAANNAKATTAIYPGRTVCLPAGATQPPVTTKPVTTTTAKPATTTTAKPKTTPTTAKPATTTTAKPKPATTTTKAPVVVPTRTYSRAEVEAIIREVWPDELEDKAVAIAKRESNLIPTARNSCCLGLFQIYYSVHKTWLAAMGITSSSQLLDPRANAYAALVLYNRAGGWGPWGG
jgi:LysM repeat protein